MADWGMRPHDHAYNQPGGVEWFSSSGATTYGSYGAYSAPGSGYGGASGNAYEDEPPLLEELGIDIGAIFLKTRAVLFWRFNSRYLDDLDMGGALIFVFVLAGLQLLMGKLHFGVTLGWGVVFSIMLWFMLRQLVGPEGAEAKNLDLYGCCCVVGYSMLPLVVYNAMAILIPKLPLRRGPLSLVAAALCTVWAALTASRIFARRCPALGDLRGIIMYPCLLAYSTFTLLMLY